MSAQNLILALHVDDFKMQATPGTPQVTLFYCTGLLCLFPSVSLTLSLFIELCGWEVSILDDILSSSPIAWVALGSFSVLGSVFPRDAITKHCKLGGLKQQKYIVS